LKKRFLFFLYFYLYWIGFFLAARLFFMLYNHALSFTLTVGDWCGVLLHGLHMDASMSGYFALVAAVILAFTSFAGGKTLARILSVYTFILLVVSSVIVVADMELYRYWGFRLDNTPLSYLKTPGDAMASVTFPSMVMLLAMTVFLVLVCRFAYRRWLRPVAAKSARTGLVGIPVFLLMGALMILPIRGNLGIAPMNISFAYFHPDNIFANHSAINVVWNAGKSLLQSQYIAPFHVMDDSRAETLFDTCYPPQQHTDMLLNQERPNVILIILEGFSDRMIAPLGGLPDVTPNINRLCKEGVAFSNIYSNSDRTYKGILGVLSGYPVHPTAKTIDFAEKIRRLPFLSHDLRKAGYSSTFVHGGDIHFANIIAYLINAGFDKLIARSDFPPESYRGHKWGVHDHLTMSRLLEECNQAKEPFFNSYLSLSSHEPFDVPMPTAIEGADDEHLFLNAAFYTDKALGDFVEEAKKTAWWKRTLIVITADHGIGHPGNVSNYHPERFHIPMLWIGGAVAKSDTIVATIGSQTDISLTLLHQLGLQNEGYRFSKDILGTPINPFAFFVYNNGFGFVTDNARISFDNVSQTTVHQEGTQIDDNVEAGRAYLQVFANDFIRRDTMPLNDE
jgi:phosphoglycerol transferase MdoB-like AlkP superfamily enzyme